MHVPLDASVLWAAGQPQHPCGGLLGPGCAALQGNSEGACPAPAALHSGAAASNPPLASPPVWPRREGAKQGLDIKAGSYALDRFCMEPTSIKVGVLCGLCCGHWQGVGMLRAAVRVWSSRMPEHQGEGSMHSSCLDCLRLVPPFHSGGARLQPGALPGPMRRRDCTSSFSAGCLPTLPRPLIACCSRLPTPSPQVKVPGSNEFESSTLLTRSTYSLDQASGFAL